MIHDLSSCGSLHSDICGSMCAYHSPQLFAVDHVLLRLLMPRHSPCALAHFTSCKWVSSRSLKTVVSRLSFFPNFVALLIVSYLHLFLYSVFKLLFCIRFRKHRSESTSYVNSNLPLQWAQVDSNHRPHAYQACALTT